MNKIILSSITLCCVTAMANIESLTTHDVDGMTGATTAMTVTATTTSNKVPYVLGENYFVNNNVDNSIPVKIKSSEDFEKYFGMATTMGDKGKPTQIDFSKQYVIAVVKPVTDTLTIMKPVSLKKDKNGNIVFTYKIKRKGKQSYSMRPMLLLVIDRQYDANVVLKEE